MMTESYMDYLARRLTVLDLLPTALHGQLLAFQTRPNQVKFVQNLFRYGRDTQWSTRSEADSRRLTLAQRDCRPS
jgi:hypothetical protein